MTVTEKTNMSAITATIFFFLLQVGVIVAEDPQLIILLADYGPKDDVGHLFKLNIHHMNISRIPVGVVAPVALDYDHKEGLIYFTDVYTKQIRRVDINGGNDTEVAKFNSTSSPEGLTLDEKTRQVFYTDNGNNVIGRVEMDNFDNKVIINTRLDKPRGIVADTKNRKLYWVDFGSNPKIETSDYDGEERSAVIQSGLLRPFEITLDEDEGRLYWTEVGGVINSFNLNNTDRRAIATLSDGVPSHISLFNGFMYLTYFHESQIVEALPLDNIDEATSLISANFKRPKGIHAFSPNFEVKDPCPYGRYGRECSRCGACKEAIACEKTTGVCFRGCKPGYTTVKCTERCLPGTFGVDCQSTCNCRNSTCDMETGSCPDGCPSGWKGTNCSIQCTPGTFGQNCASRCSKTCKSNTVCDSMSGICAGGCQSGWKGAYCTERESPKPTGPPSAGESPKPTGPPSAGESPKPTGPPSAGESPKPTGPPSAGDHAKKGGPSVGLIAGVVGGVVAVIALVVVLAVVVVCVVKRKRAQANESEHYATMTFDNDTKGIINPAYATASSFS